ncbi:MAG: WHG domain-containing protein [Thermomicrobiales bacterium]
MSSPSVVVGRSARAAAIVAAALAILESEGREALTMRRLADAVGIRAPSLYKHFPDKAAVELVLIEHGFTVAARAFEEAIARDGASLETVMTAYRAVALAHPHLYRLMTAGPLPRHLLAPGVEARAAAPLLRVLPQPDLARAAFAFGHGMIMLELDARFPPHADIDAAWRAGTQALQAAM